ncbi:hypothetical protein GCM10009603_25180 [Nocardiopsis exhalans]
MTTDPAAQRGRVRRVSGGGARPGAALLGHDTQSHAAGSVPRHVHLRESSPAPPPGSALRGSAPVRMSAVCASAAGPGSALTRGRESRRADGGHGPGTEKGADRP